MWWIYALLSALFAALTAIFAKIGIKNINSDLATAIRTLVILIIAWVIVIAKGEYKGLSTISKHTLTFLIFSGISTGISWIFYFKALQLGAVSKVAPIDKLSVALAIVLSVLFLNEALSWQMMLGGGLIIAGTLVLILL